MDYMKKPYYLFTPMRVMLISASSNGKNNFMPASWCFPLSFEPLMFGVSISKKRFTYDLIHKSKEYVINIPGSELKQVIEKFGRVSGRDQNKFALTTLTPEKSEKVNAVSIKECIQFIECEVINEIETGDHVLFVGQVKCIRVKKQGKGVYQKNGELIEL